MADLVPGLVCCSTVGRLWWLPGTLLLSATAAAHPAVWPAPSATPGRPRTALRGDDLVDGRHPAHGRPDTLAGTVAIRLHRPSPGPGDWDDDLNERSTSGGSDVDCMRPAPS